MRNQSRWLGGLCLGLVCLVRSISAQETAVSALSVLPTAEVAEHGLPPIPYSMLVNLSYNKAEDTRLGLSPAQREQLAALYAAQGSESSRCQAVLNRIDEAGLRNFRFQAATQALNEAEQARLQLAAQHVFTKAQRAAIRQTHRREMLRAASTAVTSPWPPPNVYPTVSLRQHLLNGDLLSVLEATSVQEALAFTDEQWLRVEAVRKQAYPAAQTLILQLRDEVSVQSPLKTANPVVVPSDLDAFTKETMALLTEAQRKTFDQLTQTQRTEYQTAMQAKRPIDVATVHSKYSLVMTHGGVRQTRSLIGPVARIDVVLHNAFDTPEIIEKLALTETQQKKIARKLQEFQTTVTQQHNERQQPILQKETAHRQQIRARVEAHNAEFQSQLADLLTPEQSARLKQEVWKGMSWAALQDPEFAELLQLTEEQKTAIDTIRKIPAPQMPSFTTPDSKPDDFFQRSQEFQKKMSEHHAEIARKLVGALTPQQHEQYEKLTGVRLPKPMTKE